MKTINKRILILLMSIALCSCARSRTLEINGKKEKIAPYGWMTLNSKDTCIIYSPSAGSIVLSVIFSETIIAPVFITGLWLFEPMAVKNNCKQPTKKD